MPAQNVEDSQDSVDNLRQSLQNLLDIQQAITSNPKPNYNIDGQEVAWADYLALIRSSITAVKAQIVEFQGPFVIEQQGYC